MKYILPVLVVILSITGFVFADETVNMPITKVILYKHGVGYFERSGKVKDNAIISLTFKKDEMPDVLKSLAVIDLGGGRISEIEYDSKKPLEKILEGYSVDLSGSNDIISLLTQLKGAPIDVKVGTDTISGTLIGIREKEISYDDKIIKQTILDVVNEKSALKSFMFDDIKEIILKEPETQKDIQDCLNAIFQYGKKELKRLSIKTAGKGEREVVIGYVIETPVWKTSYRAVIAKDKNPFFEGWAIVDNASGEDWNNISISLVSGLPVSFFQDLYTPHYRKRPVIEMEREEPAKPVLSEQAFYDKGELEELGAVAKEKKFLRAAAPSPYITAEKFIESREIKTITQEAGDLFEYIIDHPVSIADNRSAAIPIVGKEIEGERVSLYNEGTRADNPMSALWLKNTTGLTLEGGPVTVYEDGTYAGEAILDTLKPDERHLISYAVDLGIKIDTSRDSEKKNVYQVVINRGTMNAYYKQIETKKYTIKNNGRQNKKIIIEHPFRTDWKLVDTEKPAEETKHYYRFKTEVEAGKTGKFVVKEENACCESYAITNITPEYIEIFVSKNYISPHVKDVFNKITDLKSKISQLDRRMAEKEKQKTSIVDDQSRIRENIKALGDSPAERKLGERYVEKLEEQENELQSIKQERESMQREKEKYIKELNEIIDKLSFEKNL